MNIERTMTASGVNLAFVGRLDAAWSEPAARALEEAIRSGRSRIDLDLSQVDFISSVGIGVLLQAMTRFRKVGGALTVTASSTGVREMLRVAKLESLLVAPLSKPTEAGSSTLIGSGWTGEIRSISNSKQSRSARVIDEGLLRVTPNLVALGHLALAGDITSARGLFGEGLVAGGTVVVSPAEAPRPDYLASSDAGSVSCIARDALVVDAPPDLRGHFEWNEREPIMVHDLAGALVEAADAPICFIAIGECAGAFGAWARTSPDCWPRPLTAMSDDELRMSLRFAGEPMHIGDSVVAVGFAANDATMVGLSSAVADRLVTVGKVRLHAHVAVTSYRPVPRSTTDIGTAGVLLSEQPLRVVMHALRAQGSMETAFRRGTVWAIALSEGVRR